jgi:uridine kinase
VYDQPTRLLGIDGPSGIGKSALLPTVQANFRQEGVGPFAGAIQTLAADNTKTAIS